MGNNRIREGQERGGVKEKAARRTEQKQGKTEVQETKL